MAPTFVWVDDATLKKTENEVAAVLIHMRNLRRFMNRLRSSLLRLPTEILVHILSFVMQKMWDSRVWPPIFRTCHRIHKIMSTATELWWRVDSARLKAACVTLERSKGNPQMVIADLNSEPANQKEVLEYWREQWACHGRRLHTLQLYGAPSDVVHFSWIFEQSLPRLRDLTITFSGPPDDEGGEFPLPDSEVALLPVTLQLPMDMPLRVLCLHNATLPWSSNHFTGLCELYLNVKDCPVPVEITGDELLRILEASSQLEKLSLVHIGPRTPVGTNERQLTHERTVPLPSLAYLFLGNSSEVVGYILAHIDIPAITSLQIRSHIPPQDVVRSLHLMLPDDPVQKRLVSNPPVFEIRTTEDRALGSMFVNIGSFKMWFDFDLDDAGIISNTIVTHLQPLVPPSTTALKIGYSGLGLDELRWREFVISHPEVRSIECSNSSGESMSGSLWEALSPTGTDLAPPCPKLEAISLFGDPASTPLLNCLLNRKNAGFELKYLQAMDVVGGLIEEFNHLVETLKVDKRKDKLARELAREWSQYRFLDKFSGLRTPF